RKVGRCDRCRKGRVLSSTCQDHRAGNPEAQKGHRYGCHSVTQPALLVRSDVLHQGATRTRTLRRRAWHSKSPRTTTGSPSPASAAVQAWVIVCCWRPAFCDKRWTLPKQ